MKTKQKPSKKAVAGLIITILVTAVLALKVGSFLPVIGDHNSPANAYIGNYYILHAMEDTNSPNIVTAVLADYRGFDTLFETCVLFLSGLVVLMILAPSADEMERHDKAVRLHNGPQTAQAAPDTRDGEMQTAYHPDAHSFGGVVLDAAFRMVVPVIMIYGIYVLFHGEVSLGGGFQAGALLACAYLLDRIIPSFDNRLGVLWEENAMILAGAGTFFYAFTGILPMFNGGNFLEFEKLPFGGLVGEGTVHLHSIGILMVEIGVTICVMAVIINILEIVMERTDFDD